MPETLIEAADVAIWYGARRALGPLNLTVRRGEFWGIVGPNGAGKTTLLHALAGLTPRVEGKLAVCGHSACAMPRSQALRQAVGVLLQHHDYVPEAPFTVEDVVGFGRTALGTLGRRWLASDRDAVERALGVLGLTGFRTRLYRELSGGERRKVQIARLLAQESELLLMDEPVAGLDMDWQERLTCLAGALHCEHGKTVLFVTHDVANLPGCCTNVLLLNRGQTFAIGAPAEVLCPDVLSRLYGCPICVERRGDRYVAFAKPESAG